MFVHNKSATKTAPGQRQTMTTKTRGAALPLDTILDGDCIEVMRSCRRRLSI
jgi:hypothetical protein